MSLTYSNALAQVQQLLDSQSHTIENLMDIVKQVSGTVSDNSEAFTYLLYSGGFSESEYASQFAFSIKEEVEGAVDVASSHVGRLLKSGEFKDAMRQAIRLEVLGDRFAIPSSQSELIELQQLDNLIYNGKDGVGPDAPRLPNANSLWDIASEKFVSEAQGKFRVIVPSKLDDLSVFVQSELPALLDNTNITTIDGVSRAELKALADSKGIDAVKSVIFHNSTGLLAASGILSSTGTPTASAIDDFLALDADSLRNGTLTTAQLEAMREGIDTLDDVQLQHYRQSVETVKGLLKSAPSNLLNALGPISVLATFLIASSEAGAAEEVGDTVLAREIMDRWAVESTGAETGAYLGAIAGAALVGVSGLTGGWAAVVILGFGLGGGYLGGTYAQDYYDFMLSLNEEQRTDVIERLRTLYVGDEALTVAFLNSAMNEGNLTFRSIGLITESHGEIIENAHQNIAWRYALRELNPFVVEGANYDIHNQGGALDWFDHQAGTQTVSDEWLIQRARFLGFWRTYWENGETDGVLSLAEFNTLPGLFPIPIPISVPVSLPGNYHFVDYQSGAEVTVNGVDFFGLFPTHEILFGGTGNETLAGGEGGDFLFGGDGNDALTGGQGNDHLEGGADADTYYYSTGDGSDTIIESGAGNRLVLNGEQVIRLRAFGADNHVYQQIDANGNTVDGVQFVVADDGMHISFSDNIDDNIFIENWSQQNNSFVFAIETIANTSDVVNALVPAAESLALTSGLQGNTDPEFFQNASIRSYGVINGSIWNWHRSASSGTVILGPGGGGSIGGGLSDGLSSDWQLPDTLTESTRLVFRADDWPEFHDASWDLFYDFEHGNAITNPQELYGRDSHTGIDYLRVRAGRDVVFGQGGNDVLSAQFGAGDDRDYLDGGDGADIVVSHELRFSLSSGAFEMYGANTAAVQAHNLRPTNTAGDILMGGANSANVDGDFLAGGAGDDQFYTGAATRHNLVLGGDGSDSIQGGDSVDRIFADGEAIRVRPDDVATLGNSDASFTFDARDTDYYTGFLSAARTGFEYNDVVHAGGGDDFVEGGLGDDRVWGGAGNDVLVGDRFESVGDYPLTGTNLHFFVTLNADDHGQDRLYGGDGDDTLYGGGQDDTLVGGRDNDLLIGGDGNDTYYFQTGDGQDTIEDDSVAAIYIDGQLRTATRNQSGVTLHYGTDDVLSLSFSALRAAVLFVNGTRINTLTLTDEQAGLQQLFDNENNTLAVSRLSPEVAAFLTLDGDDTISVDAATDAVIDAGEGNDTFHLSAEHTAQLIGGAGRDSYTFGLGAGAQSINHQAGDTDRDDRIVMDAGILPADISYSQQGNDLLLSLNANDSLRIVNFYDLSDVEHVHTVVFDNGVEWSWQDFGVDLSNSAFNSAPDIDGLVAAQSLAEDQPFSLALPGDLFTDINGDALSFSAQLVSGEALPSWLIFDAATQTFSGTPGEGDAGEFVVNILADDGRGGQTAYPLPFSVAAVNDAPTALNDTFTTLEHRAIAIHVSELLANDSDIEGDGFALSGASNAQGGTLDVLHDAFSGSPSWIRFIPNTDFTGLASFDYTVVDEHGDSSVASVSVDVLAGPAAESLTRILGTELADTLQVPTAEGHYVFAGLGNDTVDGSAGDDVLLGGVGGDILRGGAGNDILNGGFGHDAISGGAGDDELFAGAFNGQYSAERFDNDSLSGGAGNDIYHYARSDGAIVIDDISSSTDYGQTGNNVIRFANDITESDVRFEIDRRDHSRLLIYVEKDNRFTDRIEVEHFFTEQADRRVRYDIEFVSSGRILSYDDVLTMVRTGTDANETLVGSQENDLLYGGGGHDLLQGHAGDDRLFGEAGYDSLEGGAGNDTLDGGDHYDEIFGGDGDDTLIFSGFDKVYGGRGSDTFIYQPGLQGADQNPYWVTLPYIWYSPTNRIDYAILGDSYEWAPGTEGDSPRAADPNITDTLYFGDQISVQDVQASRYKTALILSYRDPDKQYSDQLQRHLYHLSELGASEYFWLPEVEDILLIDRYFSETFEGGVINEIVFADARWQFDDVLSLTQVSTDGSDELWGHYGVDILSGGDGNDILRGGGSDDTLIGDAGDDQLYGEAGDDTLMGGKGRNYLDGSYGNDVFVIGANDGHSTIKDQAFNSDVNRIQFVDGITASDISLSVASNSRDLLMTNTQTGSKFTVRNIFYLSNEQLFLNETILPVHRIEFSDVTLNVVDIAASLGAQIIGEPVTIEGTDGDDLIQGFSGNDRLSGNEGDDVIYGGSGNDRLEGGDGNDQLYGEAGRDTVYGGNGNDILYASDRDTLYGQEGDDTYVYSVNSGSIVISDRESSGTGTNTLVFDESISQDDLRFRRVASHLDITVLSTGEKIRVSSHFSGDNYQLEFIRFANQVVLDVDAIQALTLEGSDSDDVIEGSNGDDVIYGGEGDDELAGRGGNDILSGDGGTDTLYGENGTDTYLVAPGDGRTIIYNQDLDATEANPNGSQDVLRILGGLGRSDIRFSASGVDLVVSLLPTNEKVVVKSFYLDFNDSADGWLNYAIQRIEFENDAPYTLDDILTLLVQSTAGDDDIRGYGSSDILSGGDGNDRIDAQGGDDEVNGDAGNDQIYGGQGADVLRGGTGDDWLYGEEGNDTLYSTEGNNRLIGGKGDDLYVVSGSATTTVNNNYTSVAGENDVVRVSEVNSIDQLSVRRDGRNLVLDLFGGASVILSNFFVSTHSGDISATAISSIQLANEAMISAEELAGLSSAAATEGNDTLYGTASVDVINGLGGDDIIYGNSGNDTLSGGEGHDSLHAGDGTDVLFGNAGNDIIYSDGNDIAYGGTGDDILAGGGDGDQTFYGDAGNDRLDGGIRGNDQLFGGSGMDVIYGRSGDDILSGDTGDGDRLFGAWGADIYLYAAGDGDTYILDEGSSSNIEQDTLRFAAGIERDNLLLTRENDDLLIQHINGAIDETITVASYFVESKSHIEIIEFADGIQWSLNDVAANLQNMPQNQVPVLNTALLDQNINEDSAFTFTLPANTFTDADGDSLSYNASLANGDALPTWLSFNAITQTFSGTPGNADVGALELQVTVNDGQGGSVSDNFILNITNTNDAPVAVDDTASVDQDTVINIAIADLLANDTDIDIGDTRTITSVNNALNGSAVLDTQAGVISFTPNAGFVGDAQFDYVLTDAGGLSDTATVTVSVLGTVAQNTAPTVSNTLADQGVNEDSAFSFVIPENTFIDADGDNLSYSATLANGDALPSWLRFDAATRTFSGTPDNADVGTLELQVVANDGQGGSVSDNFMLTIANTNDAPLAVNDSATSDQDTVIEIAAADLLANDSDVDGDSLTLVSVANAQHGSVVLNVDTGTIVFTPDSGFVGDAAFDYTVDDGEGGQSSARVNLTITAVDPATEYALDSTALVSDASAIEVDFNSGVSAFTSQDGAGEVMISDDGQSLRLVGNRWQSRSLNYTVTPDTVLTLDLQVQAGGEIVGVAFETDDIATRETSFALSGSQQNWGLLDIRYSGAGEVETLSIPVGQYFTGDFDRLVFIGDADAGPGSDATFSQVRVSEGDSGEPYYAVPAGATWASVALALYGSDAVADELEAQLTSQYSLLEGERIVSSDLPQSLSAMTAVNSVPEVTTPLSDQAVNEDSAFTFTVPANTFTDADGDSLSYSATLSNGDALPSWLSFDTATQTFSGTPDNGDIGALQLRVTVDDGQGGTVFDDFVLTVNNTNDAPVAANDTAQADQDTVVEITIADLLANDSDSDAGDTLSITAVNNAQNGSVVLDTQSGVIRFTPDVGFVGDAAFDYTVDDGQGGQSSARVDLTITAVDPATEYALDSTALVSDVSSIAVDFDNTVSAFTSQDGVGEVVISDDGQSLRLVGNRWQSRDLNYTVTPDTVLTLDLQVQAGGEIVGIAFETDGIATRETSFALSGSQQNWGLLDIRYSAAGEVETLSIPVGQYFTGDFDRLVFIGDADAGPGTDATFSHVRVSEGDSGEPYYAVPAGATWASVALALYGSDVVADELEAQLASQYSLLEGERIVSSDLPQSLNAMTAVNSAPEVAAPLVDQSANEDSAFTFALPANTFSDADGDSLSYNASLANGDALPSWLSFDMATQTFSGTPDNGDIGALQLRVTVDDGQGGTVFDDFVLTVNNTNDAPVAANDTAQADQDTVVEIAIADLLANDSDSDAGDTLSITAVNNAQNGSVVLDTQSGVIRFTPDVGFVGDAAFDYTVDDGQGGQSSARVDLTITAVDPATEYALDSTALVSDAPAIAVDFDNTVSAFTSQDGVGEVVISDDGQSLRLVGNRWQSRDLNYTVTPDTVLTLDLQVQAGGEIVGIAFETDGIATRETSFALSGSQQNWGLLDIRYSGAGEVETLSIPVGQYFTGDFDRLVFIGDADTGPGTDATFSHVRVSEGDSGEPYYAVPTGATWASVALALYGSDAVADELEAQLASQYSLLEGERIVSSDLPQSISDVTSVQNMSSVSAAQTNDSDMALMSMQQSALLASAMASMDDSASNDDGMATLVTNEPNMLLVAES